MIIDDIITYANGYDHIATIICGILQDGNKAICFRPKSVPTVKKVYYNKKTENEFLFEIIVASMDQTEIINQMEVYEQIFSTFSNITITGHNYINVVSRSSANFRGLDDNERMVYTMDIKIRYDVGGN